MIAQLTGLVIRTALGSVVLDVNGVGYQLSVSPKFAAALVEGERVTIQSALIVREDAHILFGFETVEQLEMFDLLRSVNGVGPKSALGIVGFLSTDEIRAAVSESDDTVFARVSGIGPKTAKLIIVTLSGKLAAGEASLDNDLVSALLGLGYREADAKAALRNVTGVTQQEKLRSALAQLARS